MTSNKSSLGLLVVVTLLLTFTSSCGSGSSSSSGNSGSSTSSSASLSATCSNATGNCATLTTNNGLANGYVNGAFTTVTVCVPGTSSCAAVSGVLVDTGSVGLRLLRSAVSSISLAQSKTTSGDTLVECYPFVSSYLWGPVATADIQIAGETASSTPVMLIDDSTATAFAVPAACSSYGGTSLSSSNSVSDLGANGILGIGNTKQDCGSYCTLAASSQNDSSGQFAGLYFDCATSSNCAGTAETLAAQVPNPVSRFTKDNNGTAISLPSVASAGTDSLTGALYFGIGTETNNAMSGTTAVLTLDATYEQFISTNFNNTTNANSYIDSGSNGFFFVDSSIPTCSNTAADLYGSDWFCPTSTLSLSATNTGASGSSGSSTVSFSVSNANTLFSNTTTLGAAYSNLGGPGSSKTFDWGLPFFYGRTVYSAIEGNSITNAAGTTFTGPFVAY